MPEYLSPGVYVEEVPSAVKPIAGVSTSTAAFIGIVPDQLPIIEENPEFDPTQRNPKYDPNSKTTVDFDKTKGPAAYQNPTVTNSPYQSAPYLMSVYPYSNDQVTAAKAALVGSPKPKPPAEGEDAKPYHDARAKLQKAQDDYARALRMAGRIEQEHVPVLCTSFADFKKSFGDFSLDPNQNALAHGVYGFFDNGGTRCWVMRFKDLAGLRNPENLEVLEAIDEISLVAAPGVVDPVVQTNIVDHCARLASRFAILDAPANPDPITTENIKQVGNTDYGAVYFPRVKVFDLPTQLLIPDGDGEIFVSPSGHIAGIYSRTDHERGVHKAPANEVVRGALTVETQISKNLQDGLNPGGINCIRHINDNITVWGARTVGGDANTDLKYINVRRTLIFLRKSIEEGTQWVVFEPNDRALWAKIVRNITAFLTTVWRDGALFGSTPQEAFYVKCDDQTNPPEERDLGKVTTEIGVAIVRPAEFVIFRISQWSGPTAQ